MIELKMNFAKTISVSIVRVEVDNLQVFVKTETADRQTETHTEVR
jgi:hypothetical protein